MAIPSGRPEVDAFGLSCQAALREKTMSDNAEKLNDFRRFFLQKVAGSEVGKAYSSRAPMYVSAKGRRELKAKIGLNSFKEVARIRRERKPLGDGEEYIGAECS